MANAINADRSCELIFHAVARAMHTGFTWHTQFYLLNVIHTFALRNAQSPAPQLQLACCFVSQRSGHESAIKRHSRKACVWADKRCVEDERKEGRKPLSDGESCFSLDGPDRADTRRVASCRPTGLLSARAGALNAVQCRHRTDQPINRT